jgi:hypothetical protein
MMMIGCISTVCNVSQSVSQSVSGGSEIPEGFGAASIEHWTMEAGMLDWVGWSVVRGNNK